MRKTQVLTYRLKAKLAERKAAKECNIDPKLLENITSNQLYFLATVAMVGERLAGKYEINLQTQLKLIQGIPQLTEYLKSFPTKEHKPLFILFQNENNHWISMCILRPGLVYYDDPHSKGTQGLTKMLKSCCPENVEFLPLSENENPCDGQSCGAICLRSMEMMIQTVKINGIFFILYKNLKAETKDEITAIKTNLKIDLVLPVIEKVLANFQPTSQSCAELQKFIQFSINMKKSLGDSVDRYVSLLNEEMRKQELKPDYKIDKQAISEMQNDIKSKLVGIHPEIFRIEKTLKEIVPDYNFFDSSDENGDNGSKNIDSLHSSVDKFKFVSNFLKGTIETDQRNKLIQLIGEKFRLDSSLLQEFFKGEVNPIKNDTKQDQSPIPVKLEEVLKRLPTKKGEPESSMHKPKPIEQLLAEIAQGKDIPEDEFPYESGQELTHYFKSKYENNSEVLELEKKFLAIKLHSTAWEDKDISDIRKWAEDTKTRKLSPCHNSDELLEAIAIMDRAFELTSPGHRLRGPQLLSVLEFLITSPQQGKLCEISTGEGKTIIIAVLVAIKVLQGQVIDVLTSNQVLASEAVESTLNFYSTLGLTVTTNNLTEAETSCELKARACYKYDVVYGTISNFQYDYLRDTFEGYGARGGRPFGSVILDEVDNLVIDNGSYIAKLAGPFPGMEALKYIYLKIWQELIKAEAEVITEFEWKLAEKIVELKAKYGSSKQITEHEANNIVADLLTLQIGSIKDKIKSSAPSNIELIPSHLKSYCESMNDCWIDNALFAKYSCNQDEHYVIKEKAGEDVVIPVDYQNTGVTMKNTIWSDGLHQFVQLKHNLQLTTESLTSSFISNIGYIRLYNNRIFGMTGTLGSEAERALLSSAYKLSYTIIPRFQPKLLVQTEGLVVKDSQWMNMVALEAFLLAVKGRSVLVICQTIKKVHKLRSNITSLVALEGKGEQIKIKFYEDEDGFKIVHEEVGPGEVILATNIAGRGTDFKTKPELETNGGLHVIVCFLPYNQRVQDQAFGRTARQGNLGTAQLILRESDLAELDINIDLHKKSITMENIVRERDNLERIRLEQIQNEKLVEIDFNDGLFNKFSAVYSEFKTRQWKKLGGLFLVEDFKEFWAFWLHSKANFLKGKNVSEIDNVFQQFEQDAAKFLGEDPQICWNPHYSVRQGDYFIRHDKIKEAEDCIQRAIDLSGKSSQLLCSAYFKLFEIEIEKGCQLKERFKQAVAQVLILPLLWFEKNEAYKEAAKTALNKAISSLDLEIGYIKANIMSGLDDTGKAGCSDFQSILIKNDSILIKHLNARYIALAAYRKHASSLLGSCNNGKIGICINSRLPYLRQLNDNNPHESELKASLTESTLAELESVGCDTIYALREVHDAHHEVIIGAQVMIGSGVAALGAGIMNPLILPIMGPIAGALISEGICDIVIELLSRGHTGFDWEPYIKGKCISFGIALATAGISAIAMSTKVLNEASKACKGLASLLRKCPYLRLVCEKLATQLDKLGVYFEKLKLISEFSKLTQVGQLERLNQLQIACDVEKLKVLGGLNKLRNLQILQKLGKLDEVVARVHLLRSGLVGIGKQTLKGTVGSIISEKIVTAGLNKVLQDLKPKIEQQVRHSIQNDAKIKDKLKRLNQTSLPSHIHDILTGSYGKFIGDVLKEITFGVLRHSNNWTAKLTGVTIDSAISISKIVNYVSQFQEMFEKLQFGTESKDNGEAVVDEMVELIIRHLTDDIFIQIMQLTGKYANTFLISPVMKKVWSLGENKEVKEPLVSDEEEAQTFKEIADAYETLGVKPGATLDEIKKAYHGRLFVVHPTRGGSEAKLSSLNTAHALIQQLYKEASPSYCSSTRYRSPLSITTNITQLPTSCWEDNSPAHLGNIITLSNRLQQTIVVKTLHNNKITEIGSQYKNFGKDPLELDYLPPTPTNPVGHFSNPSHISTKMLASGFNTELTPSSSNSCLYDALVSQLNFQLANSPKITATQLRDVGESVSTANIFYDIVHETSSFLNNPLTKKLYIQAQRAILVGGDLIEARGIKTNFFNDLKSLNLPAPQESQVIFNEACNGNKKAIATITKHSPTFTKFGWEKKHLKVYQFANVDNLTSFIVNFKYDKNNPAPMILSFPNGINVAVGEDLYAIVAYRAESSSDVQIADDQYKGENLGSVYNAFQSLTDKDVDMDLWKMPEICGRLICESIRNKATFVSACLAMIEDTHSPLSGGKINNKPLPVTAKKGIKWEESSEMNYTNPDHLLHLHVNSSKYSEDIDKFYKVIYKQVRFLLNQDDGPCEEGN